MDQDQGTREDKVKEFHDTFGAAIDDEWTPDLLKLRRDLMQEEMEEVAWELYMVSKVDTPAKRASLLKELADLQYVLSGTAVALGLDLEEAFNRVHESNMSKAGEDGKAVFRPDGKILKGPNYKEPDLKDLV